MENGIDPKSLQDYVATANSGKYKSWDEINSKFPEFKSVDKKLLQDYVATANSGKYKGWEEINSKFPEFKIGEQVKKKELALPSTDFSASSQFLQEKPTTTIPFKTGVEVEKPKVKVNRENIIKRAEAGEVNPDLNELADLNQRLIKGGVLTAGEIERGELDKGDIDDFTLRTRAVRDLREKSIEKSKALENGAKKIQQQGQALIQQYEQAPSPELKSQIEQLDKDYQLTVREYKKERYKQDIYEKRLVQTSDSIKRLANEQLPDDFFSGFYKGLKGNINSYTEAIELARKSKKEQIEYAKTKALQAPTKEAPLKARAGEMIGGVAPDLGVNIGFSLAGLPGAGAAVVTVRQGAQQAADDFVRAFNQAKEEGIETGELDRNGNPILREATDDEAYDIATKAAGVGFGTGALEGLAGSVTGGVGGKLADRATTTVGRVLTERTADVGLDAGISATMQTGRNLFDRAQGLQTSVGEGVLENAAGEFLLSAPVNVVAGRKEIARAKKASNAAKEQLFDHVINAKDNPEELKKLTENLEIIKNQGLVTESEYNDIVKKAQQYEQALPTIPEEIKNKKAAADLIIERNDLAEKAQTVDEAYKKPIEERIKQINEELLKVDEKPITPTPTAEVTLPEVEVTAEKPAPTEAIEAQKVEVKEEPKEVVAEEVVVPEKDKPKEIKTTLNEIMSFFGETAYNLVKKQQQVLGEDFANLDRIKENANRIIQLGEKDKGVAVAEALQYEIGSYDNWSDLRNAIKKGGIDNNSDAVERMIQIGIKLPNDIVQEFTKSKRYENASKELVKAVEDLLGKSTEAAPEVKATEAEAKAEEVVPEGEKKKTTKVSDFLRENLTTKPIVFKDKDGNEMIVARQGLDWNDMVNKVADLIDKGYEAALAVKEYLKSQDWFKSLNKDQQDAVIEQSVAKFETSIKEAEKGVKEFTKEVAKTIKDLSNNIDKLKQKVTDAKSRIESIKEQGKKIKEWINANRKELKGLTDAQFVNLSKKLTDANLQSDINKIMDYLNKSLSNADYNDKLSQAKKLNKDLKKLAKRPTTLVNESEALKRLASIPPSSSWDIDKLNEYNAFVQGLMDSVGEARNKKGTPDRTEKPITTEEIYSRYDKLKSDYDNDVFNKLVEDNEAYFMAQGKGLTPADLDKIKKDLAELNGDDLKKQEDALARLEQRKEFKEAMKQIVSEQVNKVLNLDRSQFTERQNSIIDGLKNIDLEKANTRSLIELNNVLNNIETNGDFSNAGRAIEAEARSQEGNKDARSIAERFKLFKFKTDTFWNLVRTKRSFDAIMQRLTLKSADAQAKLNVALGDTDLSRSHVKVRKFVDSVNQTIDKYIKKNKPSVEDIHTLGTVYRLIQNSGIGDVDKQDQFNQIKEDFKASIENLKKGTEKEKALGELQQKIYDKLDLDNVNNQKELIDNFSKINPKGMEIINNLIKEYSKIEPLFRENQELYNNTTYTPLENYLPIQNKTLKSKQTTDLETSDDFSRNSMGINKSLSKSSIKRVGLNRSNQYMNTDFFNVVSKKAVDVANQAYTLADRVAIEKTINSDEFQETFGEDNASVLRDAYKAKVDHIMNIYPMQGEINKFAQVLNKISSAGAVRAIGGALQSIKQPVVLVNTVIQLAQNGNADLIGKALKIYSSKDEGFRKMLDSAPISLRETTKAGTAVSSEVDTVAESELKKGLTELYKKFNLAQEEIADKVLVFLKKGDTMPAEVSWAAYYMESLRKQGQDINQIDWDAESKNPNKEALAYAEAMVSNKQNVSDPANISKVIGSKDAWFQLGRSLLAPLSSYSFNTRNRLNDDFLALARGGDRKEATKDIIATAAEMYAYSVVAKTLYSLLLKPASDKLLEYFGFDPEKDPREWDEIISDIAKNKAKYGLLADFISTGTTVFGEEAGKRLANSVYKAFNDEEPKVGEYANMTSEQWMDYWKEQSDYERTLPFREKPIPDILSGGGTIGIMGGMGYNAYEALNYVFDDQNRFEQTQRLGENTLEGVKTGELVASSGRTKELTDKEKEFFVLSGIFGTASFVMPMLSELTSINRMAYQKAIRQAKRKYGEESERKLPTGFYTKYQELQDKRMKVSQDKSITSREQNEKLKEIDKELDRIEKQRAGGQEIKPKK